MENKNTVVALVLMLLVWTGFTYLFPPQQKIANENESNVAVEKVITKNDESITEHTVVDTVEKFTPSVVNSNIDVKQLVVENDKFIAKFTNLGANLISFKLKDYKETNASDSPIVTIVKEENNVPTLVTSGSGSFDINNIIYDFESAETVVVKDKTTITFTGYTETGLVVLKNYHFVNGSYIFDYDITLINQSKSVLSGEPSLALHSFRNKDEKSNRLDFIGPASFIVDEVKTDDIDDIIEKPVIYTSGINWTGFETKYFMSSIVVLNSDEISKLVISKKNNYVSNEIFLNQLTLAPSQSKNFKFKLYFGPKDVNKLKAAGHNLEYVVDYGFFKLLAKPLHTVLNYFYGFIGNYGISIIFLTIILKMIFWPLTQKSYVSMRAMQTLQPEMKKLREKYSGDKEGLNKKMMELYKEHRVNPMGGCLPMLVQIPVFFALYKVLLGTIELRHAPFMFWITDLSIKDPYYITPVVMGITMFIQQKLTPSTMDPMQAKLMMGMPVIFTFMFLNFPAGLVIYWLVNNLLTIFQQYLIYKKPA